MKKPALMDDPQHWRQRAEEARRIAGQLSDPVARKTMEEIAVSYDRLADLATKKSAVPGKPGDV
jgi:hypothetical protein